MCDVRVENSNGVEGSNTTRSASMPGATAPFRDNPQRWAIDAEVPQLHQPVLDHRQPVRDLREVAAPERLLLAVERAVVGRDALEHAAVERGPQELLVALLAQRRRTDVAGSLEVGPPEVVDSVGQVLEAGLPV